MSKCFRPSDIILAKIISLGDQNNYLLSTAGDELGISESTFLNFKYFFQE